MAKTYVLQVNYDEFKNWVPSESGSNSSVSMRCKGKPLAWKDALVVEVDEDDVGMPEADISLLNIGSFVISEKLRDDLFEPFSSDCEFLPLQFQGRKLYLVNVVKVVDCLNKTLSTFNEFGGVSEIVFDKGKVPTSGFFKIAEDNFTSIFCAEDVYELVRKNALSGVNFEEFPVS